jgi:hypothetical protein
MDTFGRATVDSPRIRLVGGAVHIHLAFLTGQWYTTVNCHRTV